VRLFRRRDVVLVLAYSSMKVSHHAGRLEEGSVGAGGVVVTGTGMRRGFVRDLLFLSCD
jgi:hypothetical protein